MKIYFLFLVFQFVFSKILKCLTGVNGCDKAFVNFFNTRISFYFDILSRSEQMPGYLLFIPEGQGQGEIKYTTKPYILHTEKYHVLYSIMSNLEEEMLLRSQTPIFPQQTITSSYSNEIFDNIRGTYYIYSYASPCIYCANMFYQLIQRFKNINFKIFYSETYYNDQKIRESFFKDPETYKYKMFYKNCRNKNPNKKLYDEKENFEDCYMNRYNEFI